MTGAALEDPKPASTASTDRVQDNIAPAAEQRVLSTLNLDGTRRWIRPKLSPGRFQRRRLVLAWVLIAIFIAIPYLRMNGKPLILLDVLHREFTLFGVTFLATDTFYLMLFMIGLLVGIFLLTALFGRVWCGWACPQTVYMEFLFRPLERWIEGGRGKQLQLDRSGPNWRRMVKLPVFFLIAMFLAHIFLAYFVGVDQLVSWVRGSPANHPVAFLVMAGTTLAMFFDFAYFREQTCLVACPYGRFQSVLLDRNSLIVGYDTRRGEPRGKGKRTAASTLGDCVDCRLCVTTCPTGIDIRDGLQMECVGCTQCIDACDAVMDKVGKPRGLIRYSSQDELAGGRRRVVRPRVAVYGIAFAAVVTLLATLITTRQSANVTVVRAPGRPFSELPSGGISNSFRIKVANRSDADQLYELVVTEAGAEIRTADNPLAVSAGETKTAHAFIVAERELFRERRARVTVRVSDRDGFEKEIPCTLLGPDRTTNESSKP